MHARTKPEVRPQLLVPAVCLPVLLVAFLVSGASLYTGLGRHIHSKTGFDWYLRWSCRFCQIQWVVFVFHCYPNHDSTQGEMEICVPMLLLGAPFYLRNWLEKGNPIFPLGYAHFGGEGWDLERAQGYAITLSNYGMGRDWIDYLLILPRIFLTQDMVYFFQGSLGPMVGILFVGSLLQGTRHIRALIFVLIRIEWTLFTLQNSRPR